MKKFLLTFYTSKIFSKVRNVEFISVEGCDTVCGLINPRVSYYNKNKKLSLRGKYFRFSSAICLILKYILKQNTGMNLQAICQSFV